MHRLILLFLVIWFYPCVQNTNAQTTDTNSLQNETSISNTEQNDDAFSDIHTSSSNSDYDDDQAYNEESTPDTNVQRYITTEAWQKIKKDKEFIYTKNPPQKHKPNYKPRDLSWLEFFSSGLFKFLLYAFAICFLGLVVYNIFKNSDFSYFTKRKESEELSHETVDEVEQINDWDKALAEALRNKDYRLATRLLYKQTLQTLNHKNLIQYEKQKTNWDYVKTLSSSPLYKPFINLTKYFDYIWYGSFTINEQQFEKIRLEFVHFNNEISA